MNLLLVILTALLQLIPSGPTFLEPLCERDSALVADQFRYGFELGKVEDGTELRLVDPKAMFPDDTLVLVSGWQFDTLKTDRRKGLMDLRVSVILAPFEAGKYELPPLSAVRVSPSGEADTLSFDPQSMTVFTMPVDTATFQVKDLKAPVRYPVTFKELIPWFGLAVLFAGLIFAIVLLVRRLKSRGNVGEVPSEPAYIVALKTLEKFRGEKFWAPEKQKMFYSGITDALKEYMGRRFEIDAPEMTTAELFAKLESGKEISPELYAKARELFETADFVKFAKHTVSDDYNAGALPLAIRFVMETYKAEEEPQEDKG